MRLAWTATVRVESSTILESGGGAIRLQDWSTLLVDRSIIAFSASGKAILCTDAATAGLVDSDVWGNPDLGDEFRKNIRTSVPTLFISGTFDVRTPPSNAEEVRKGFKNSYHLIIDGAVHSDPLFLSSPKILETMMQFMRGEKPTTLSITLDPIKFQQIPK